MRKGTSTPLETRSSSVVRSITELAVDPVPCRTMTRVGPSPHTGGDEEASFGPQPFTDNPRRFPPQWDIERTNKAFIVGDQTSCCKLK